MGTYNRHVKFELKIPNYFGKMSYKLRGRGFDSHAVYSSKPV